MVLKRKKGNIYLSGGGDETQSLPFDSFFMKEIPKNGSILYIPFALLGHKLYKTASDWIHKVFTLHNRDDVSITTLDTANADTILCNNFDAIYIGGGNTWLLLETLRKLNLDVYIMEYLARGGAVYGGSAGAIVLGHDISTAIGDEKKDDEQSSEGFDYLDSYSVTCHYSQEKEGIVQQLAQELQDKVLALPEESGLLIQNGVGTCLGTEPCSIFDANGHIMEFMPGESFTWQ